jgi:uncharacterized protein (TIGR00251 family)
VKLAASSDGRATLVPVKVVPNASRSRLAGRYGDGVKVQVAAPPERGRANEAVCAVLAEALGVAARDVTVVRGHTSPTKTLRVEGLAPEEVARRLAAGTDG